MIEIDEAGTARVDTLVEALNVCDQPGVKRVVVRDKDEERKLWSIATAYMGGGILADDALREIEESN